MTNAKIKPEMHGTTSRWNHRAYQKESANVRRRHADVSAVDEGLGDEDMAQIRHEVDVIEEAERLGPIMRVTKARTR